MNGQGQPQFKQSVPYPLEWVRPGQWVFNEAEGRFGLIRRRLGQFIRIRIWRFSPHTSRDEVLDLRPFMAHWQPCSKPEDPRTSWELIIGEDLF